MNSSPPAASFLSSASIDPDIMELRPAVGLCTEAVEATFGDSETDAGTDGCRVGTVGGFEELNWSWGSFQGGKGID